MDLFWFSYAGIIVSAILFCAILFWCTVLITKNKFTKNASDFLLIVTIIILVLLVVSAVLFIKTDIESNESKIETNISPTEKIIIKKDTSWWEGNVQYWSENYDSNLVVTSRLINMREFDSVVVGRNTVILNRLIYPFESRWCVESVINNDHFIKIVPHSDQDLGIADIREQFKKGDTVDIETYFNDADRVWFAVRTSDSKIVHSKFYPDYSAADKNKDILQAMVYAPSHEAVRKYGILHPWKI